MLGVNSLLDGYNIGAILPTGIGPSGGTVPNVEFMWAIEPGLYFRDPIHIIPEPSSLILACFAAIGLFVVRCRLAS